MRRRRVARKSIMKKKTVDKKEKMVR